MPMTVWLSIVAAAVVMALCFSLYRRLSVDRVVTFLDSRRPTSRIVSAAEFADGNRRVPIALALTTFDLFYENGDMQASLDLRHIREIEYDVRLATGHPVVKSRVLRLRSFSQVFEFVIADNLVKSWENVLPARRRNDGPLAGEFAKSMVSVS
jgi:hypothetical protein